MKLIVWLPLVWMVGWVTSEQVPCGPEYRKSDYTERMEIVLPSLADSICRKTVKTKHSRNFKTDKEADAFALGCPDTLCSEWTIEQVKED